MIHATCGDTQTGDVETWNFGNGCATDATPKSFTKTVVWAWVYWLDGYKRANVAVKKTGQAGLEDPNTGCVRCWPGFDNPTFEESGNTAYWMQKTYHGYINVSTGSCSISAQPTNEHRQGHTCNCAGADSLVRDPTDDSFQSNSIAVAGSSNVTYCSEVWGDCNGCTCVNGGNGDGQITASDSVFDSLRLWQDFNHNGVSEPSELHTLIEYGVASVELNYRKSKRKDEFGNIFRYRAKVKDVHGLQVGRWAGMYFWFLSRNSSCKVLRDEITSHCHEHSHEVASGVLQTRTERAWLL